MNKKDINIMEIAIMYAEGNTKKSICQHFNITNTKLNTILNKKLVKEIIKSRQEEIKKTLYRAYSKVDNKFVQMVETYINKALEEDTIDRTSIYALSNVMVNFANRFENIAKLDLEREKIALEREKLALQKQNNDNVQENANKHLGLLEQFYSEIKSKATKLNRKEE